MVEKKYQHWLNHKNITPVLKEELLKMNGEQINDAFYTNVEFGTAGMRGILGAGTNRLNIFTLRKANLGFAKYILANGEEAKKRGVAISYDNRHMSKEFAIDCANLMAMHGIKSYVFKNLRPTPELSYAVRHFNCFGGIMITASHNPKEHNGYKIYDETGCQLVPELVEEVINYAKEVEDELDIEVINTSNLVQMVQEEVDVPYNKAVLDIQLNPQLTKTVKIVFTPQHGTAIDPIRVIFNEAGYDIRYVENQCTIDPDFSNTLSPNPEVADAYVGAIKLAKEVDADIVLTTDPDADRLGVAVKHNNDYVLMTGNQSAAVLLEYMFSQLKEKDIMPKNPVMFNTIVTADIGEKIASSYGVETEKTLTGFKFIGNKIAKYEKTKEKSFVFGYEESYGCLLADFVRDKDALQACIMLAEASNYYLQNNKTLIDVLHELYDKHGWYLDTQKSENFAGEQGLQDMNDMLDRLQDNVPTNIGGFNVVRYENYFNLTATSNGKEEKLDFLSAAVLKYYLSDGSWIAIRPSGTEPKCKFYYCIKGNDNIEVDSKFDEYLHDITKLITKN